ncbi:unnamed protein product [Clonostachys rosea f. rosea IK726]|uniref:RmlD-like substrate binding domain-containing protein n=2 Tax=Bionectria ochroleuca TaxID=29856 RepID=A0A0B7KEX1_BIOOC|nr:unnamed protein product [Clonostachys rosea f. rosea IK726]
MSQRTAIVTGATGLLGRQVKNAFETRGWTAKGTGYSRADGVDILKVDLGSEDEVRKMIDDVKPQVIVHCAAQRFPDKVDKDPEGAKALNVEASRSLARLAAARDILLIYISTDYVFPGPPGDAPYEADAEPKPTNLYGQTKFDGERAVLDEYAKAGKTGLGTTLRVPVLYGVADKPSDSAVNVLLDIVQKADAEKSKVMMDHWAIRYPTNTEDIGRVCHDVAEKYLGAVDRSALPTILQFSSEDKMTKYEICQKLGEILNISTERIEPNTQGNDPQASVQRPYDCHLSTKVLRDLGIDVSTIDFADWWRRHGRTTK